MNIVLFDDPLIRQDLLPFTYTRPVGDIRIGMLTLAEKWKKLAGSDVSFFSEPYLSVKYPAKISSDNFFINGAAIADVQLLAAVSNLKMGEGLVSGQTLLAVRADSLSMPPDAAIKTKPYDAAVWLDKPWKIFQLNGVT